MLRFDINLIFTVVNLLVLYFLMKKFLFDKVNAIFRQRQELIDEDYAAAEAARAQAETDRETYTEKLTAVEQEVDRMMNQGREQAHAEYNRIIAGAQTQAQKEIAKAQVAIGKQREDAMRSFKTEVGQLVAMAAGKIMEEDVPDAVGERLYEEMMAQAGERK